MSFSQCAAVLLLPAMATGDAPSGAAELRVGNVIAGAIEGSNPVLAGHGPSKRFGVEADADGRMTLTLDSYDFDALLRVETAAGATVAEDDNGGIETNSRIVLEARKGERYVVVAAAVTSGGMGEFALSVAAGDVPRSAGASRLDLGMAYRSTAADRALARGDLRAAGAHRRQQGMRAQSSSRFVASTEILRLALALSLEAGDRTEAAKSIGGVAVNANSTGQFARAQALVEKALRMAVALGDRVTEANGLNILAIISANRGQSLRQVQLYERSLEIFRAEGDRKNEAMVLGNLGGALYQAGRLAEARECQETVLELARALGDRSKETWALGRLGLIRHSLGDNLGALDLLKESVEGFRALGDRKMECERLGDLGRVYDALGQWDSAREHYRRALDLSRELGDRLTESWMLGNLGLISRMTGDPITTRRLFEEQVDVARKMGYRRGAAAGLANLGLSLADAGEYASARACEKEALAVARELGELPREASAVGTLGLVFEKIAELGRAKKCHQKQLDLSRQIGERAGVGYALANLGVVHQRLGDYVLARKYHREHLELARATGNLRGEMSALGNLANVHLRLGELELANECYGKSLELSQRIGDRNAEATTLGNMAHTAILLEDFASALPYVDRSIELCRALGERTLQARGLSSLARILEAQGKHDDARRAMLEALDIGSSLGDEAEKLGPLAGLVRAAIDRRDIGEALDWWQRAEPLLARPGLKELESMELAGQRSRRVGWSEIAQDLVALRASAAESRSDRAELGVAVSAGFREASRWKGGWLLQGMVEHASGGRTALSIDLNRQMREAAAKRDAQLGALARAIRDGRPSAEVKEREAEAASQLGEVIRLADRLRLECPRETALRNPVGVARRALVSKGTALVEYAEGRDRLYAYVLDDDSLELVDLGDRAEVDGLRTAFLAEVSDPQHLGGPAAVAETARALYDRILEPVVSVAGAGARRWIVVPTVSLATIPFDALAVGTKGGAAPRSFADVEFAIDRWEMICAPSTAVLVQLASEAARVGADRLLVLADPEYPSEASIPDGAIAAVAAPGASSKLLRGRPNASDWNRLPKTRQEVLDLAIAFTGPHSDSHTAAALARLRDERSGSFRFGPVDAHVGREANRSRLTGNLRDYSVIHLACHGYVDLEVPNDSAIALSGTGDAMYLSIGDVLNLDLDADLVVLSACETAKGKPLAGEGVQSLAAAFVYAGTRSVISSLWNVSDQATAETMRRFYEHRLGGASTGDALRRAKLDVRRSGARQPVVRRGVGGTTTGSADVQLAHPFFWAPFAFSGVPR